MLILPSFLNNQNCRKIIKDISFHLGTETEKVAFLLQLMFYASNILGVQV